jgi:hypothetical protein
VTSGDANTAVLDLGKTSDTDGGRIAYDSGNNLLLHTASTERLRITSAGNVGIGTASPARPLDVNGTARLADGAVLEWGGTSTRISGSSSTNTIILATNNAERMRIDSSGNVGIGTSSPTADLSVGSATSSSGDVHLRTSKTTFELTPSNSDAGGMDINVGFVAGGQGPLKFSMGGTERARIDSSGNLLVGRTSNDATVTGCTLGPIGGGVTGTVSSGANEVFVFNNTATGGTAKVAFRTANVEKGSIAWTNASTAYNTSSDYRLKENVQPMQDALAVIAQLNPVTYTWKVDGSDGQGFIAHELQAVVPDCVTGEKDAVDEDGNPKYQGVDTSFLVATLVAALKELKAEVDSLRAQLNP